MRYSSNIVKNDVFTGKNGYTRTRGLRTRTRPDPYDTYPYPTRTRGYGSGRVYPRVWVDPHTSSTDNIWCTTCLPLTLLSYPP